MTCTIWSEEAFVSLFCTKQHFRTNNLIITGQQKAIADLSIFCFVSYNSDNRNMYILLFRIILFFANYTNRLYIYFVKYCISISLCFTFFFTLCPDFPNILHVFSIFVIPRNRCFAYDLCHSILYEKTIRIISLNPNHTKKYLFFKRQLGRKTNDRWLVLSHNMPFTNSLAGH